MFEHCQVELGLKKVAVAGAVHSGGLAVGDETAAVW